MAETDESDTQSPAPQAAESGSSDDRNLVLITHLSGILFGWIVPLIVWLVHKDRAEKSYVSQESKEALNFQITVFIGYVISWILLVVFIGAILWWICWILNLIFCILAAVEINRKGSYRYPLTLRLLK